MDPQALNEEVVPVFYIGQHEVKRSLPITDEVLRQAQDCNYDMLTTPITTPYFHSRVLSLLSSHLAESYQSSVPNSSRPEERFPPVITPLSPVDTPLTPSETISQLLAVASPWIDLCSPDPLIANISRQVLNLEIAYAAFCGVGNIIIHGPRYRSGKSYTDGLAEFARAVLEALNVGSYLQIQILLPIIYEQEEAHDDMGYFGPLAREEYLIPEEREVDKPGLLDAWDTWNVIRSVCKYHSRLFVALSLPANLPSMTVQSRWHSEPLRLLCMTSESFVKNARGYPVLSRAHRSLISRYMRLRTPPWILLIDVGPIPGVDDANAFVTAADGFLSPGVAADAAPGPIGGSPFPTPAEASRQPQMECESEKVKDQTPHLNYMRYLQRNQPSRTVIERFGSGYQDYLQAPLQPLTDNLESVTYEVFERDPVKYDWYERAIRLALEDWFSEAKPFSHPNSRVVLAVVGAGRGPLVTRALQASEAAGVPIEIYAVEKNHNAYVLLQRHNESTWGNRVHIIKSDMRSWRGPSIVTATGVANVKVDIFVSELLGSFADNELSPECLDGVQHHLSTPHGISIPSSYTAHLTPIAAPRLHADISQRTSSDPNAPETPYVVMLHSIDFLSTIPTSDMSQAGSTETAKENSPNVKLAWSFSHPIPPSALELSNLRRGGSEAGGGGGLMGGSGANEHNARYSRLRFGIKDRGVCHGLAGYFETVLYEARNGRKVELSTNPLTMEHMSKDMISWFPIYFPLKTPLYLPDHSELEISIWRQTDDRKVWYEWMVEAFALLGAAGRVRLGMSDLHSSRKNGCMM